MFRFSKNYIFQPFRALKVHGGGDGGCSRNGTCSAYCGSCYCDLVQLKALRVIAMTVKTVAVVVVVMVKGLMVSVEHFLTLAELRDSKFVMYLSRERL